MEVSNSNTRITFLLCAMHQRISAQASNIAAKSPGGRKKVQPRSASEPAELRQRLLDDFKGLKSSVEAPSRPWPEPR
jgi:hypothetical protein